MPVEIKELLIEINVASDSGNNSGKTETVSSNHTRLMSEYAEKIMQVIDDKKER